MTTALHGWLNRAVNITLQSHTPAAIHGTLFHVDDAGIMLERGANKLFIPFAAILHVESCDMPELQPSELSATTAANLQSDCFWRPHA